MAYKIVNDDSLTSVANAIRTKGETSAPLTFPNGFVTAINNIPTGGGGYTVDDIAMHSISGAISGSASIIANYAFYSQAITEANFPNAIGVSQNAFCYCQSLVTVTMPNVTTLSASVFYGCYHLATVSMPNLQQIGMGAFYTCSKIETLSLPMVSFISNNAFKSCRKLMSLYLLSTSAVELSTTAAFSSTPMHLSSYTGSFGSIYVPASLVDTYKSATNWSEFSDRITSYVE